MLARMVVPCALLLVACDDSVDLHLIAPVGEATRPVDYSCVDHILVIPYVGLDAVNESCIAITPGRIDTLRDHHLGGLVDLALPNNMTDIFIAGMKSGEDCLSHTIFHGEALFEGGWDLDIPLRHALDCDDYTTAPTTARVLDLAKLVGAGADRCAPLATPDQYNLELIHHFLYDAGAGAGVGFDPPQGQAQVQASGIATFTQPHFTGAVEPSCLGLRVAAAPAGQAETLSCVDAERRTICDQTNVEVVTTTVATAAGFGAIRRLQGTPVAVVLVWDGPNNRPLAGATVRRTVPDPILGASMLDLAPATGVVTTVAGTVTTASGLAAFELVAPTSVTISHPTRTSSVPIIVSASDTDAPGIHVLRF